MADLERVLALEPRHYGALTGVGTILREVERNREALAAFRAALEVHPHLGAARQAVERLRVEVEGREG
jgi:cytochrome c-type biogenesis protein CcmH/NrfG